MRKVIKFLDSLQIKAMCAYNDFKDSERGDTNFISMLIIIGIVVVLAGLFLTFGKTVMSTVQKKVVDFLKKLK